jgi:N-acetylglucosamine-6-phosphate deacetylase
VKLTGRVVTPTGVIDNGLVEVEGDRIVAVRRTRGAVSPQWIVPGFVDLHVHGGGGYTFTTGDPEQARGAIAFHRRHGTTTMLASLVTAAETDLADAVRDLAPLVTEGALAGLHLEGPYLSAHRCGAQNPHYIRDPCTEELERLLAPGVVRMVTLAPERPGALDAIGQIIHSGAIAAVGHTDASYEETLAAIAAGASVATHLGNAMRPIHHREPGPMIALLDAAGVVIEQIADGVHLHDGMLRHTVHAAGSDRVALITDAMAAAGMPDGPYELGGQAVTVAGGVARLAGDGAIAGSTLTMDAALRRAVHSGVSMVDAARMAATTPARVLGLSDEIGAVHTGLRADIVVLDDELRVTIVLRSGVPAP